MKNNRKYILVLLLVLLVVIIVLMAKHKTKFPLLQLDVISGLKAEDLDAIVLVNYDMEISCDVDYSYALNLVPELIIGNPVACKDYFSSVDLEGVAVEEDSKVLDQIMKVIPSPQPGGENAIGSLDDTGLAFITKDGKLILLELILRQEPKQTFLAWYPCDEIGRIVIKVLKKHGIFWGFLAE